MKMTCEGCHQDIHLGQFTKGRAKKACDQCHSPAGWIELLFDHDNDSRFKLKGAHEKVGCLDCHAIETRQSITFVRFKPVDPRCISCHANEGKTK